MTLKKKPAAKKVPAKTAAPKKAKVVRTAQSKDSAEQRRKLFIEAYLSNGENVTQAAVAAGFSEKTAASQGSRLLKSVKVQQELNSRREEVIAKVQRDTGITLERTLREIARGAFHDPRKFFDDAGNLKPIHELDDETAAALAGFDVTEEFSGRGQERERVGFTKKIKLADRKGYLDMLMKHLGGYKKDNEQGGEAVGNALSALLGQMRRSALPVVRNPDE
jgi:phage terminase small subunit